MKNTCQDCIHVLSGMEHDIVGIDTVVEFKTHRCARNDMRLVLGTWRCDQHETEKHKVGIRKES